jgi:hypothetical protein
MPSQPGITIPGVSGGPKLGYVPSRPCWTSHTGHNPCLTRLNAHPAGPGSTGVNRSDRVLVEGVVGKCPPCIISLAGGLTHAPQGMLFARWLEALSRGLTGVGLGRSVGVTWQWFPPLLEARSTG